MKGKRFTDEQIAYALRQAEGGTSVVDVCRQLGVSEASFSHISDPANVALAALARKTKSIAL